MFKRILILIILVSMLFGQDAQRKGIHQIELEHHKIYYLEPTHKPVSTPPIPLKKRVDGPSKIIFGYYVFIVCYLCIYGVMCMV